MTRRKKHPDPPPGCPVRLIRPASVPGTSWGEQRVVLVSMLIADEHGKGRRELWRIPGHNGWGDRLHSSVYHENALVLATIYLTEGIEEDCANRWAKSTYLTTGGALKHQLADEEVAGKIRGAFPGISLGDIKLSRTLWLPEPRADSDD